MTPSSVWVLQSGRGPSWFTACTVQQWHRLLVRRRTTEKGFRFSFSFTNIDVMRETVKLSFLLFSGRRTTRQVSCQKSSEMMFQLRFYILKYCLHVLWFSRVGLLLEKTSLSSSVVRGQYSAARERLREQNRRHRLESVSNVDI